MFRSNPVLVLQMLALAEAEVEWWAVQKLLVQQLVTMDPVMNE
jgi:hypothetical protein